MEKDKKQNLETVKFMDFCAGIGAGRLGLEKAGHLCVGFSEIDKHAEKTYRKFFGENEINHGDLMKIDTNTLPDFQLMIAGFPCQSFSIMGQRKGIQDERGQIIFGLIRIMLAKDVKYFILENVKGLVHHDKGNSLRVILSELDNAGYKVSYRVLNSIDYGVPQMRERIYFVGVKKDLVPADFEFEFPASQKRVSIKQYLRGLDKFAFDENSPSYATFIGYLNNKYNKGKYSLDDLLKRDNLIIDTRQSDLRLYEDKIPTLRTGRHGILYVKNGKLKKLSGYESILLQGFTPDYAKKVENEFEESHILRQTGNAMTASVIEAIAKKLFDDLKKIK